MKLLYSVYEIVDKDGVVLEKGTQRDAMLAKSGRDGDIIRETRGSVTSIPYVWHSTDSTWKSIN